MSSKSALHAITILLGSATIAGCAVPAEPDDKDDSASAEAQPDDISPDAATFTLTAATKSATSINVRWNPFAGATEYVINRSLTSNTEKPYTSNSPATALTFLDSHLTPNQQYCYRITAYTGNRVVATSNQDCIKTPAEIPAPTGVVAALDTCCSPDRITVSWQTVAKASRFVVLQSENGGAFSAIGSVPAATLKFTAASLTAGATYTYEIETEDVSGNFSTPSGSASETVPETGSGSGGSGNGSGSA